MKKLLALIMAISMLMITACSEEAAPTVETFDQNTTESTEATTAESTEPDILEIPTDDFEPVDVGCEVQYSSVKTHRDSVGNVWIDAIAEVKNTGSEAICLTPATMVIYANDVAICTLEDVECFPKVIEPGQVGYYFEQSQQYVDEDAALTMELDPSMERANGIAQYMIEDSQLVPTAFGVGVQGAYPMHDDLTGMIRVAAILFDHDQKPMAVLFTDLEGEDNHFVLESDKLPEDWSMESISSYIVYVYRYAG